jgi:phenylacetate-CoA ligase
LRLRPRGARRGAIVSIRGRGSTCVADETVKADHFYPEIIDPQSGEVLQEGEHGEIVFTSLAKEAMPVIRYRTRDLTRLMPGRARSMRRMEKVTGRSDDMVIVRGVNVFPTQIEAQISRCEGLGPHFQIELRRDERLDSMRVLAEARASHADRIARDAQSKLLALYIRNAIGLSVEVVVDEPGKIERSAGKARRVVDLRGK